MGKGVQGQWYIDLSIAGTKLPADPYTMPSIEIINNIHQDLPSIYFKFKDPTGDNSEMFRFKDGDPIGVSIGVPGIHIYEGLDFRLMGHPRGDPSSKDGVTVQGVLNNMMWKRKILDKHIEGNSHEVFSQLASMAGLKPVVDVANDKMTWLPNRTSLVEYARFVADRAYGGDSSCFLTAVTDTGKALFKDIDKIVQGGSKKLLSQFYEPGSVNVLSYEVASKTHVANNSRGYGATTMSVKNDGSILEFNKIDVRGLASALPFSMDSISSAIGTLGNRIAQVALLPGNTHENWVKALHQNMRIKSLYAFDIHVLTDTPSQLELLDKVDFKALNRQTGNPVEALLGSYIVTAITKTITGQRYYEKITITSQSAGSGS